MKKSWFIRQCTVNEKGYELLHLPQYCSDLASSDLFFLFADLKNMLAGKKISTNYEVIVETEGYFEANEKS